MSETYDVDEYISPETGEQRPLSDPDADRKRVIIPVDGDKSLETKLTSPPKKEAVKKPILQKSEGRKPSPRLRRASRPSQKTSSRGKTTTTDQNIKKFTILIPDELLRKFRIQALTDGVTYSALGVEAIQSLLKLRAQAHPAT